MYLPITVYLSIELSSSQDISQHVYIPHSISRMLPSAIYLYIQSLFYIYILLETQYKLDMLFYTFACTYCSKISTLAFDLAALLAHRRHVCKLHFPLSLSYTILLYIALNTTSYTTIHTSILHLSVFASTERASSSEMRNAPKEVRHSNRKREELGAAPVAAHQSQCSSQFVLSSCHS